MSIPLNRCGACRWRIKEDLERAITTLAVCGRIACNLGKYAHDNSTLTGDVQGSRPTRVDSVQLPAVPSSGIHGLPSDGHCDDRKRQPRSCSARVLNSEGWVTQAATRSDTRKPGPESIKPNAMISKDDLGAILEKTTEFWVSHVNEEGFVSIFSGKEIGHRVADYVDETTVAFLNDHFQTGHQLDSKGKVRVRSMGDVWIHSNNMYNPVNVKAGEYGMSGQPNLVSLTKLINALLGGQIDSYYLLFVKTERQGELLVPHVYLVDMLDYLEFVTFDAGPGQAMLKESAFFAAVTSGYDPPDLSVSEKLELLFELLEDGDRRLAENRQKKMTNMRTALAVYREHDIHEVNQKGLNIG